MKFSSPEIIYLSITSALLLFGYRGVNTISGRRVFDEMAGMIPFFLGLVIGGLLMVLWIGYRVYLYCSSI